MEGPNPNEIFQREGVLAQNTKQINGQVIVAEATKKTRLD